MVGRCADGCDRLTGGAEAQGRQRRSRSAKLDSSRRFALSVLPDPAALRWVCAVCNTDWERGRRYDGDSATRRASGSSPGLGCDRWGEHRWCSGCSHWGRFFGRDIVELATRAYHELSDLRRASVGRLIETASTESEREPEELLAAAQDRPETAQLLLDSMTAASETLLRWKVDSLGKALANGLADDGARVDEERLVVRAIGDLEPPHVRTLAVIAMARRPLTAESIEGNAGLTDAGAVVPVLVRYGLVEERRPEGLTIGGAPRWQMTRFGRRVLAYLGGPPGGVVMYVGGEGHD
jgi:hypothetical protein